MIALLIMTDGRDDLLARTVHSALNNLVPFPTYVFIHDDTGDPAHAEWIERDVQPHGVGLPWWIITTPGRSGFGGAIRNAWAVVAAHSPAEHIFHLEDDFLFNRHVDLNAMISVLDTNRDLVQLALRRQPWNQTERTAGGIVESRPDEYDDREQDGYHWLEHRLFFTTNPSLYRRTLLDEGWPDIEHSEGMFTHQLLAAHPDWRFGFWGSRDSGTWVHHIGDTRQGMGY